MSLFSHALMSSMVFVGLMAIVISIAAGRGRG